MHRRAVKGHAYTWGDSYHTILGHNHEYPVHSPERLSLTSRVPSDHPLSEETRIDYRSTTCPLSVCFTYIACGPFHTALISEQGGLYTFGANSYKQLGHSFNNLIPCRVPVLKRTRVVDCACGQDFTLALSQEGLVYS